MALETRTGVANTSLATDAHFRAWAQNIHDMLAALGCVNTADSGQINLTTVTKPASGATYAGYEIWRFDDAEQATFPIYFKLEYGTGSIAGYPGLRLTVGAGSDGAGVITGTKTSAIPIGASNFVTSTVNRMAGGMSGVLGGRIAYCANYNTENHIFCMERLRDDTGAVTTGGVVVCTHGAADGAKSGVIRNGVATVIEESNWPMMAPNSSVSTGVAGTDVGLYTITPMNGPIAPPILSFIGYMTANVTQHTELAISRYGTARTYRFMGGATNSYNVRSNGNVAPAMLVA